MPEPSAPTALADDWHDYAHTPAAARAPWQHDDPRCQPYPDLHALRAAFEDRHHPVHHDGLLADLHARAAAGDRDALRVVLEAVRPGLITLARRITGAWTQTTPPAPSSPPPSTETADAHPDAANLLGETWHDIWRIRARELAHERLWGQRKTDHALDHLPATDEPATDEPAAGEHLLRFVTTAVDDGHLIPHQGRLVLLHRILGLDNHRIARLDGRRRCTVGKQRRHAEQTQSILEGDVA